MTDYERTTTPVDVERPTTDPATSVRTTEHAPPAGPGGATVAARLVTFLFGVLQVALILRIILLYSSRIRAMTSSSSSST